MKRTFDEKQATSWKGAVEVEIDRTSALELRRCSDWLDKLDTNGEWYCNPNYWVDDRTLRAIYVFSDETDAIMFKLKFGG